MKTSLKLRQVLTDARRIVVKVGSRVLVQKTGQPEMRRIRGLVDQLAKLQMNGHEVVMVTSGAIGTGMQALGIKTRPTHLPDLQMAAAVGQARLMHRYDELFSAHRVTVGQVLLTHDDFHHKIRLTNARRTMECLLRNRVVPIVNENDVVADEEIKADLMKLGDNDLLAALVTMLIRADLLILLTTADGLRETLDGRSRRVPYVESITRKTFQLVDSKHSPLSTGGMASKLRSAQTVARAGACVVIADGRQAGVLARIMHGDDVGTLIPASVNEIRGY